MAENEFYTHVPVDLIKGIQKRLDNLSFLKWYDEQLKNFAWKPTQQERDRYLAIVEELDIEQRG